MNFLDLKFSSQWKKDLIVALFKSIMKSEFDKDTAAEMIVVLVDILYKCKGSDGHVYAKIAEVLESPEDYLKTLNDDDATLFSLNKTRKDFLDFSKYSLLDQTEPCYVESCPEKWTDLNGDVLDLTYLSPHIVRSHDRVFLIDSCRISLPIDVTLRQVGRGVTVVSHCSRTGTSHMHAPDENQVVTEFFDNQMNRVLIDGQPYFAISVGFASGVADLFCLPIEA